MTSAASRACSRSVPVMVLEVDSVRAVVSPARIAWTSFDGEMLAGWYWSELALRAKWLS